MKKNRTRGEVLSGARLWALCRKEMFQILHDPSSLLITLVIPLLLLIIFGYGINFDSKALRLGLVLEDSSPEARRFAAVFEASPYIHVVQGGNRGDMEALMAAGEVRGVVVVPLDFSRRLGRQGSRTGAEEDSAPVQVMADGSEPNTANFVQAYTRGVLQVWLAQRAEDSGQARQALITPEARYWFNPDASSRNFIMPGAVTIIMTVVGAVLTSLVIAREWERGTMEALLSTRISRVELLLSKLIPYYVLGLFALAACMVFNLLVMRVPFRGSYLLLFGLSSVFLLNTLSLGLLISTVMRNQFNAAQVALNAAFLPAVMLSGFVFEISSMPFLVRAVTYIIPARYYVSVMKTLFLAGNVPGILFVNGLFLLGTACIFLGLAFAKTRRRLE